MDNEYKGYLFDRGDSPEYVDHVQIAPFEETHPWEITNPHQYYFDKNGFLKVRYTVFTVGKYIKETVDDIFDLRTDLKIRSLGTSLEITDSFNKVRRELDAIIEKIKERKKNESVPDLRSEYAAFRNLVEPLILFIQQFALWYAQYAPTPQKKESYPFSEGQYVRSSIMYFTNDDIGKSNAIKNAYAPSPDIGFGAREFIYGQDFVLKYLNPKNLFRGHNLDTINARLDRIKSGITIENVARNGTFFYGWYNVEKMGWKSKKDAKKSRPPYRPFNLAMAHALKRVEAEFGRSMLLYKEVDNDL